MIEGAAALGGRVSEQRLDRSIAALAEIGAQPDDGVERLSFSPEDRRARELFGSWLKELGAEVRLDGAGNLTGRFAGTDPDLATVMAGSHLDTQPGAGRFDGVVGVVGALEAMAVVREAGVAHRRAIEVVAWAGEEGSARFDVGMVGSRAMVGELDPARLEDRCRLTGRTLGELMRETGIDTTTLAAAERPAGSLHAVVELHVEQGPFLEESGVPIGIVTAIAGNRRLPMTVRGTQAHSGAQPMTHRHDALCGAAEIVLAAEAIAAARVDPPVVATSGRFTHAPRNIATVPGRAELVIDVRSADADALVAAAAAVAERAAAICERRGLALVTDDAWGVDPAPTDAMVADTIAAACADLGVPARRMASGAGHDALLLGSRFPAGMLFVPSSGGISHAPEEATAIEHIVQGTEVLLGTLLRLAETA